MKQNNDSGSVPSRTATSQRMTMGRLLLMTLLLFTFLGGARAQETLTVCDGSATSSNVPFWGLWADNSLQSEMIYPAEELGDLAGGTISSLHFYSNGTTNIPTTGDGNCWDGTFQVFMKEVLATTITEFTGTTGATIVYEGQIPLVNGEMTIALSKPYNYLGGNLLVGIYYTTEGHYNSVTWLGKTVSGASIYGRSGQSYSVNNANFLPKTTFEYTPADGGTCARPTHFAVSNVTAHTADLAWESEASSWQIMLNDDENNLINVNTTSYTLTALTLETSYNVKVRANCGGGDYSTWASKDFTTTIACPAPTNLALTPNALSATFTWESSAGEWEVAYATDATANPAENVVGTVDEATYTVNDLELGDYYFWVRANCGDVDGKSQWAGPASVHIGYCVPAPTSVDNNGISNVTFGMGDYIVNNDTPKATYADYTSQIGAVQAGVESTIAITFKTGYTYNTYVWVDLDNSMSFDADEVVCYGESANTNPTTLTLNFTIPVDQTLGDFRLRIGSADSGLGSDPTAANPCYSSSYGCFQDYTLRVLEAPSCLIPAGLDVTTDGTTATVTWNGTAETYNIGINGTVTEGVTNPYTFDVELSTEYTVKVQANCGGVDVSEWSNSVSFTTPDCIGGRIIEYTLNDSYGDGWTGSPISAILVYEGCGNLKETLTIPDGNYSSSGTLELCGDYYEFVWQAGQYPGECSFTFTENGTTLFTKPSNATDGMVLYTIGTQSCPKPTDLAAGTPEAHEVELSWTENGEADNWQICINGDEENLINVNVNPYTLTDLTADTEYSIMVRAYCDATHQSCWSETVSFTTAETCAKPENLAEANITTNSADLSWEGTNNSYVLQYRPWLPAGDDKQPTSNEMTSATYDLSEFTGTGSVVIRHYNCYNQFALIVDDIVVKDANGDIVFSEDFEDCVGNMPSTFTNMDMDGDGYVWQIAASPSMTVNGSYGLASYSYDNGSGILYPDNWLIINNIPMGGTITFSYCAQDASWCAENFNVYVSTENSIVEVPVTENTYKVEDLEPDTPYAWQVKGVCGEGDESNFASSFFQTLDDVIVFQTEGNWNDAANWDVNRVPTADDKVRIDAAATIPAGVVAYAKKTTIGTGSITIEDGGQLKQGTTNVDLTVEKNITGYGENEGKWYFVATPVGTTLFASTATGWGYAGNLYNGDGTYDLYPFYSTQNLEWYNYKAHTEDFTKLFANQGYLYANVNDVTLNFTGTTAVKSLNNTVTEDFVYDNSSHDAFNGWSLIGNPFTCNAYVYFANADGDMQPATFYKMNADGNGFDKFKGLVVLAPGEGAFIAVNASGKIVFSSEPVLESGSGIIKTMLPLLPEHGLDADQEAEPVPVDIELANNATDNSAEIEANNGKYANVTLSDRKLFKDGEWNTICLPFDVDLTAEDCPLAGAEAKTLYDSKGSTIITLSFSDNPLTELEAGRPYIIKWAKAEGYDEADENTRDIYEPMFTGVTIDKELHPVTIPNIVKFVGYYDAFGITASDEYIYYMTAGSILKHTGQPRTLKACRAYFDFSSLASGAREFILDFGDGEATGISEKEIVKEFAPATWYTVDGKKLDKQPTRKGVYIYNGTKVVIK